MLVLVLVLFWGVVCFALLCSALLWLHSAEHDYLARRKEGWMDGWAVGGRLGKVGG